MRDPSQFSPRYPIAECEGFGHMRAPHFGGAGEISYCAADPQHPRIPAR